MNAMIIKTMDDAERAARAMSASGFFADTKQASQAVVKILAGAELGFGPFASMTGVNIIQNKPVLAANLIAAAVNRSGKYHYRVVKMTNTECVLNFFEGAEKIGTSEFTMNDAALAGLASKDNWKKYPKNMLFARAISNGQKWFVPDAFNGATVYTPDELGASEDADGNITNFPQIEAGNPDPITDQLWERWLDLCKRADALNVEHANPDREKITKSDLTAEGLQLLEYVKAAEYQAQAGEKEQ